jgi:hypothetical protein
MRNLMALVSCVAVLLKSGAALLVIGKSRTLFNGACAISAGAGAAAASAPMVVAGNIITDIPSAITFTANERRVCLRVNVIS